MQIENNLNWVTDVQIRRLISFCCRHLDYSPKKISNCRFRKRESCFSGRAWYGARLFHVYVGGSRHFPTTDVNPGVPKKDNQDILVDPWEALVMVTAHEVAHLEQQSRGCTRRKGNSERITNHRAYKVLKDFRENREDLIDTWARVPKKKKPAEPKPKHEVELERAEKYLKAWSRKYKLAQTKVRKYRQQVRYYEKSTAAKGST
jgi:hypothetical protein